MDINNRDLLPIEDALKTAKSKFRLVLMTVERAKQLREFKEKFVESLDEHFITRAVKEIADNKVTFTKNANEEE